MLVNVLNSVHLEMVSRVAGFMFFFSKLVMQNIWGGGGAIIAQVGFLAKRPFNWSEAP